MYCAQCAGPGYPVRVYCPKPSHIYLLNLSNCTKVYFREWKHLYFRWIKRLSMKLIQINDLVESKKVLNWPSKIQIMIIHWTYESDIGNLSSLFKLIIYPSFKLLIQGSDSQCVCLLLTHRQPPEYTKRISWQDKTDWFINLVTNHVNFVNISSPISSLIPLLSQFLTVRIKLDLPQSKNTLHARCYLRVYQMEPLVWVEQCWWVDLQLYLIGFNKWYLIRSTC